MKIPLLFEETAGIARRLEPVTVGFPISKSTLKGVSGLEITAPDGKQIPFQADVLARWPDGSVKWALLDIQVSVESHKKIIYNISTDAAGAKVQVPHVISVLKDRDLIVINTGNAKFSLKPGSNTPIENIEVKGESILNAKKTKISLLDAKSNELSITFDKIIVETEGPLRVMVKAEGRIVKADNTFFANLSARMTFFAGKGLVKYDLTIHNPRAARHTNGFWDLGDDTSVYFKDLSVYFGLIMESERAIEWLDSSKEPLNTVSCQAVEIYQDSSGGVNWNSPNHLDRNGSITTSFRGYRVRIDGKTVKESERAAPAVALKDPKMHVLGAMKNFWQNFPKAIEAENDLLIFRLFPKQCSNGFELQAGEQKTHIFFIDFCAQDPDAALAAMADEPLLGSFTPEYYCASEAIKYLLPKDGQSDKALEELIEPAIEGKNTFFDRREAIDEYGWRNFGDLYADHEIEHYEGSRPLISHYNNQYDVINGAIIQYFRRADNRWYHLADDLAHHVIDIDIYHTDKDKAAYGGGLFWHTNHYTNAYTSTHRCYSKKVLECKSAPFKTGGGPSNEHNYTTGLLNYYYLTGDKQAKESVLGLAKWVISMDDGSKTLLRFLDSGPTGLSSMTTSLYYHGPGRGAGNSINALIDAHELTGDKRYLAEAEKLIKRCIHPKDDLEKLGLGDPEHRWSYLVFLQVLGKYLDIKEDLGDKDFIYSYARESLLRYASWMQNNEYAYLDKPEKLEYPTETWAAQEMRKANVFLFAAKYGDASTREAALNKAKYFYGIAVEMLRRFDTKTFTRPIAILLSCGSMFQYFMRNPNTISGPMSDIKDFGTPRAFIPQRVNAKRKLMSPWTALTQCIKERRLPWRLENFLKTKIFYNILKNPNTRKYWDARLSEMNTERWRDHVYLDILDYLPRGERFSLLDIGCALGDGCILIKKHCPLADISGCDFSNIAIEKAKKKTDEASFFVLDVSSQDIAKDYEYITLISILEHFDKPYPIIDKCLKNAKKCLIISCPYAEDIARDPRNEHRFSFNEGTLRGYDHEYYVRPDRENPKMKRIIYLVKNTGR